MSQRRNSRFPTLALRAAGILACLLLGSPVAAAVATQLAVVTVNGGAAPLPATPFAVVVQSQAADGSACAVTSATTVSVSLRSGLGTLAVVSGTIAQGQSQATLSGLSYSQPDPAVLLLARATAGMSLGDGVSAAFAVAVPAPVCTPTAGTYPGSQQVALSCAWPAATIRYTTDGSVPTAASPVYTAPIAVAATTTIRAIATVATPTWNAWQPLFSALADFDAGSSRVGTWSMASGVLHGTPPPSTYATINTLATYGSFEVVCQVQSYGRNNMGFRFRDGTAVRWDGNLNGTRDGWHTVSCLASAGAMQRMTLDGAPVTVDVYGSSATASLNFYIAGDATKSVDVRNAQVRTVAGTTTYASAVTDALFTIASVSWPSPAPISWGTALDASELNATATAAGTFAYDPPAGTVLEVGTHVLSTTFTPSSGGGPITATTSLRVVKAKPTLTWATPAPIAAGTALSATQCAATAAVAGTMVYQPPVGTVLGVGRWTIQARFVPTDTAHYAQALIGVVLHVVGTTPPVTTYQYDAANRLTDRIYSDGLRDVFTYDASGRLKTAVSQRYGNTVQRDYDADGRLTAERLVMDGTTQGVQYGYDAANRLAQLTYPDGDVIGRTSNARGALLTASWDGATVVTRGYDGAGRLTGSTAGNGVVETRGYAPGAMQVQSIVAANVTSFSYSYDPAGLKTAEVDGRDGTQSQAFGYDAADRLTTWRRGPVATPSATQTWDLSLVGDWQSTTRNGQAETRTHTPVHEVASVAGHALVHDARGNLTVGEAQSDGQAMILTWDVENRLATARADDAVEGITGQAIYRYDALGRRVGVTVWDRTTTYVHAGAQVVQSRTATAVLDASAVADDGSLTTANAVPADGGILPSSTAQLRVNFQPSDRSIPAGFVADKGRALGVRTNGLTYGWSTSGTPAAHATGASRYVVPQVPYDTLATLDDATWSVALPNGTYAVAVVAGDAASVAHANHLLLNGQALTDPDPGNAQAQPTYAQGDFDGWLEEVTVTDGYLRISAGSSAYAPTLCFVEIGAEGQAITEAMRTRLAERVAAVTARTGGAAFGQAGQMVTRTYVYGSYVDEVVAYQQTVGGLTTRYYPHYNHLYSVAALTNAAGQVVERFSYDAYGKQKITDASGNVTRAKSSVGWDRGFTGYITDNETGLMYARARQYSPTLGRFIGRDPILYADGYSLYSAYFVPGALDPSGKMTCFFCYKWDPNAPGWFGCPGACVLDTEKVNEHKRKYEACVSKAYQDFNDRKNAHLETYNNRLAEIGRIEGECIRDCDALADRLFPNASGYEALRKIEWIRGCKNGCRGGAGAAEQAADAAKMLADEGNEVMLALQLLGCNEGTGCRWFGD